MSVDLAAWMITTWKLGRQRCSVQRDSSRMVFAVALLVLVGLTRTAVAFDDAEMAEVKRQYQSALADYDAGRYQRAVEQFQLALDVIPLPVLALWTARANALHGDLVRAATAYGQAIRLTPNELWLDGKQQEAQAEASTELKSLQARIPRLRIEVPAGASSSLEVTIDGMAVDPKDYDPGTRVNPGSHVVKFLTPGNAVTRNVSVIERQSLLVRLGSSAPGSAMPRDAARHSDGATPKPERRYRTATLVAAAIGAAGISAGTVLRILAVNEKSTIDAHCDQYKWCDSTGMNAVSKADTLQTQSTIYLLLGLAAAGAGIGLAIVDADQPDHRAATLTPVVLPAGAALTLGRRF